MRFVENAVFQNQDAIVERLEASKEFGLVSDYLLSWTGSAGQLAAKVAVWGNGTTTEDVLFRYVADLLKGFVPEQHISIVGD